MDAAISLLTGLSSNYPILVSIFAVLYSVGIAFKLLRTAAKAYVSESPSKSDDIYLEAVEGNKIFKTIAYIMDLVLRLKVK